MHIHVYSQMPVRCGGMSQDDEISPRHFLPAPTPPLKTDLLVKLTEHSALSDFFFFFRGGNNHEVPSSPLLKYEEKELLSL